MVAHYLIGASALIFLCSMPAAWADQIVLANGDRLTGKVVSKSEDTLKFRTEYAGEINVRWKDVTSIATDAPVTVLSAEGQLQTGKLDVTSAGATVFISEGGSREIKLTDIGHINPPPHVAGTGVTYAGHVSLLGSASRGNTDDGRVYGEAEFKARAKEYRYRLFGRAEQKEESGETTAQNYFASAERDNLIDDNRFWYVRASVEHDDFKDLKLRAAAGAGLGIQLVDTSETQFSVRGGLDYVLARRDVVPDETYPAFGWGIDYAHWFIPDHLEFFFNQGGLASLTSKGDVSIRTRTGLRFPISSGLSANAQLNVDYEGNPGPDNEKTDTQLFVGLGYNF